MDYNNTRLIGNIGEAIALSEGSDSDLVKARSESDMLKVMKKVKFIPTELSKRRMDRVKGESQI